MTAKRTVFAATLALTAALAPARPADAILTGWERIVTPCDRVTSLAYGPSGSLAVACDDGTLYVRR